MNEDILKGQWLQRKGKIRERWGKLTDDDLDEIKGNGEVLKGKLQERYGRSQEQAEKDLERWLEEERLTYSAADPKR